MRRHTAGTVGFVLGTLLLGACTSPGGTNDDTVFVSAAASLTDVFSAIEEAFEAENPGSDVVLNFGGSSMLREQILAGAPADVFASANESNMEVIVAAGAASGEPQVFATNRLEIAVPTGNPAGVTGLEAFGEADRLTGLCAVGVPCGDFGRQVLLRAGVVPLVDTEEPNVRALLTKIEAGELDAGLVYATDTVSADGTVDAVEIPEQYNVVAHYPIAPLVDAPNPDGGETFVAFVMSVRGQAILVDHGFGAP